MADQIRDAFERWAEPQGLRLHRRDSAGSTRLGQYCSDDTQLAFEAFRAALSHAAGQDGEQCRAASGFDLVAAMESWHSAMDSAKELSANAPDERYRKRASDVVAYLMTRTPNADSALSRGVPEGE